MTTKITSAPPAAGLRKGPGGNPSSSVSTVGRRASPGRCPAVFFTLFAIVPLVMVAVLSFMSWNRLGSPSGSAPTTGRGCGTTR